MKMYLYPIVLSCFALLMAGCVNQAGTRAGAPLDTAGLIGQCCDGQYDEPPRVLSGDAPVYPIGKMLSGAEGSATIGYTVGADGKAREFKVIATDNKAYSDHAIIAVREWIFSPAKKDGKAVDAYVEQPFRFEN